MGTNRLTTEQVATMHGVTRGSVIKWINEGHLAAEKFGRDYMVKEKDAKAYQRRPITGRPTK